MSEHRFVIADDHPLFRDALKLTLTNLYNAAETVQTGTLEEVAAALQDDAEFDLVLLDLKMPGVQGFSGLVYLRAQFPTVPIAVVSAVDDHQTIRRAIKLGALGFIPKSLAVGEMAKAIETVLGGQIWVPEGINLNESEERDADEIAARMASLTPQQMRVLMMLREGLLNKQIAYELSISEATIKAHVSAILQKLNVESRTQAVIAAGRLDGEAAV
jgi:DNA-binding NarL/FixJ family response regulator